MKKIIVLIIAVFILSGCTVDYNLLIEDEKYVETIKVNNLTQIEKSSKLNNYNIPIYINYELKNAVSSLKEDGINYYEKNNLTYTHEFNVKDFYRSYFVNSAYKDIFMVNYDDKEEETNKNIITIQTGYNLDLFNDLENLKEITVRIKTNHKIKYSNGKEVENNTYEWVLNSSKTDNSVIFQIYKDEYITNYDNRTVKKALLIVAIAITIVSIGFIAYKIKNSKNK